MPKPVKGIGVYLRQIGRSKLLTKEQEIEYAQKIEGCVVGHDGVKTSVSKFDSERARKKLAESNLRLVVSIAKHYQNRGCDLDDLISEGNIGLLRAIDRFDWRRGFRFSTYASWWIKQAIGRLIANQGKSIRVPGRAGSLVDELREAREDFIELNGQEPTRAELADIMGVTETTVSATIGGMPVVVSLESVIGSDSDSARARTLKDVIVDDESESPFDSLDRKEVLKHIADVLDTLTPRELKILTLRFGLTEDPVNHNKFPLTQAQLVGIKSGRGMS